MNQGDIVKGVGILSKLAAID